MATPNLEELRRRCAEVVTNLVAGPHVAVREAFGHSLHWMRRMENEFDVLRWRVCQLELPRSTNTREQDMLDRLELVQLERDELRDLVSQRDQQLDELVADVVHCAAQLGMCDHETEAAEEWKANLGEAIRELHRLRGIPETLAALGHRKW